MRNVLVSALLVALVVPDEGESHSQLFMRPTLRIVDIVEFRHLWKFEPLSSAAIMREFDRNSSGSLDADEREHIAEAVRDGEFPFTAETRLVQSGRIVPMSRPSGIRVVFVGKELAISFSVRPRSAIRAAGHLAIWIDDAKQNTASNVGWTIGPMIGIAAGAAPTTLFVTAGVIYAALAVALHLLHLPSVERTHGSEAVLQRSDRRRDNPTRWILQATRLNSGRPSSDIWLRTRTPIFVSVV